MAVIDASFAVAVYREGDDWHSSAVSMLQDRLARQQVLNAPGILLPEFSSGLRQHDAPPTAIQRALTWLLAFTQLHAVTDAVALRAAEIATTRVIRGCDAIYVALADHLGEELITFDRAQARGAHGLIEVVSP